TGFFAQPFSRKKRLAGQGQSPCRRPQTAEYPDATRARQGVNFKQSCGLFERGDALQERACPYGEYPRHFSAIRLQKGGLNGSCLGGFPVASYNPFGHTSTDLIIVQILICEKQQLYAVQALMPAHGHTFDCGGSYNG
ncbi:MAG: hypothetical protein IJM32_09635, partial [Ruminococcus sp.]|nr:hypothetical protein [Ruminococcus sp.]